MKKKIFDKKYLSLLFLILFGMIAGEALFAQTAGQIYKPAASSEGRSILDPNGTGNVFTNGVQFHPLPQLQIEPLNDVRTGAKGGDTDLVSNTSGQSAAFMYYDSNKEALLFRVRLGGQSTASKGYSFLFNTDFSLFGPKAANYSSTNPGYQFEVVLETNFRVRINSLDSNGIVNQRELTPIDNYFQKAVSDQVYGGTENGYFYDFYVPISEIDAVPGISFNTGTTFRPVAITITNAQRGITGTISDIGGVNDDLFKSSANALINITEATPEVTVNTLNQLSNATTVVPNTLAISGPADVIAGQTSGNFTITLRDNGGSAINATQSTVFNLTTSQESGSATFNPSQVTITQGNSKGTFTYNNSSVGSGTHQITATRASGDALAGGTSASHSIIVNPALSTTQSVTSTALTVDRAYTAFTPVTASGGTGSYTYTLRNAADDGAASLPAGMSFNTSIGQISGTATAAQGETTYTVSVSDGVGTSTKTFLLTVNAAPAANGTISDVSLVPAETKVAQANLNDVFTGGTGTLTFGAVSADTDIVTVSLDGNQLSVTGVTNGGPVTVTDTNGATATQTFTVTVSSAAASTIAISGGNGQTATVGTSVSTAPTVIVKDEFGNPLTRTQVTFAVASGSGTIAPTTAVITNAQGIASVTSWTLGTTSGTNTLTATSTGLTGSPLTFTATGIAGSASKIVFLQQPTNAVSTIDLNPIVTVEFQDSNNNRVLSTDNITIGIGTNPNSGTLSGTLTRASNSDVATFSGLSIDKVGEGYTLAASSGSFNVTSNAFNITAGAASLDHTTATVPAGVAGSTTSITITVRDAGGNPLTGQAGLLAVSISEGSPNHGATLSSINDNNDGTYTVTYTPTKIGDDIIAISLNGTALGSSPYTSTVSAGAVTNFLVERSGDSGGNIGEQTAVESFTIRITARDAQENTVTGFTNTVNVALNKNSLQSGGGTTANFVAGVLASHSVQINTAATAYQITATQTGVTSPTGTSNSFNVVPASGNKIVITTQPAGGASGSTLATQPIVEVQDAVNNRVTSFTGEITVSIHSGDDGTLTGTTIVSAVAGVVTYSDLVLAGLVSENYILRFSGSSLTSVNSNNVTVTPGAATRLAITGSSTQVAGTSQNLTITAYDSKGNVSTGYAGDKNLTFSGANASLNGTNPTVTNKDGLATNFGTATAVTFTDGVASVSGGNNGVMTLYRAESATIAVQDQNEIAAAGADRLTVTVTHGSLESFAVSFSSPQSSGTSFSETNTITARDSWGNTVTNFNASATPVTMTTSLGGTIGGLGSAGNNILNREGDFTNGVANVSGNLIYSGATGTGTFTATADVKSGTSSNVTISAGTPSQIAINAGNNQSATIGTALSTNPSVIVRDAANNPVQGISVTFSITGGGGSLTDAVATTNSNGIATVGGWTLGSSVGTNTLSAAITGSSPSISTSFSAEGLPVPDLSIDDVVTNDTTPNITGLSNQPEGSEVTLTLKDSAGNNVVDGSNSPISYKGTVDAEGKWSITVTNPVPEGEYETTATVVDGLGATKSAIGSLAIDTTPPQLTVNETTTNSRTPTLNGTSNQPEGSEVTVTLKDSEGNPVLGDDGNVLSYRATVSSNGNWSVNVTTELGFEEYRIEATTSDKAGNTTTSTGQLTIEEEEPELIVSVTNVIVPGGRIGESTTITVTLQDQNGNPISGSADLLGFGLSGSNGEVQLSGITDNGDGTYSVSYTPVVNGEDLISITLNGEEVEGSPFTSIVSDDAWQLVFTQSPNETTEAGFPLGTVIVEVRVSGNRVLGYSGPISIEVTEGTGGALSTDAELIGTTTVNAENGIATFGEIIMNRSGNNYTLTATADEIDSGISNQFNITPGPPWQLVIRE